MIKMQASLKTVLGLRENDEGLARTNDLAKVGSWITGCQGDIITLLDVLDWFQTRVSALESENGDLKTSLDKRNQEITSTLELILEWKKESQETLDSAKEYFGNRVRGLRGGGNSG